MHLHVQGQGYSRQHRMSPRATRVLCVASQEPGSALHHQQLPQPVPGTRTGKRGFAEPSARGLHYGVAKHLIAFYHKKKILKPHESQDERILKDRGSCPCPTPGASAVLVPRRWRAEQTGERVPQGQAGRRGQLGRGRRCSIFHTSFATENTSPRRGDPGVLHPGLPLPRKPCYTPTAPEKTQGS